MNLGINLGSSTAAVSTLVDDEPYLIHNEIGSEITPTVVRVEEDGVVVGEEAVNDQLLYPDLTQSLDIRHVGTEETYQIGEEIYEPQNVLSWVLEQLVSNAEKNWSGEVQEVTIAVPHRLSERHRHAVRDAAKDAGIGSVQVISEPTATCFGWDINKEIEDGESVLVYDLGKQSFDVAVVRVSAEPLEVVAAKYDTTLGGANFTRRLYEHAESELLERGADINQMVKTELLMEARQAKEQLSFHPHVSFGLMIDECIYEIKTERNEFNELVDDLVDRTVDITRNLLNLSSVNKSNIDEMLLTGGSTRMPIIKNRLEEQFDMKLRLDRDPTRVVAKGAAVAADRNTPGNFVVE